jgi:putative tricarboxylic transport membrane protein
MEFLNYFSNVFTFANIVILVLGTIGGLLLGAAPGLSPTMAVALLIPFTFKMSPEQGLIMLGAVYTATVAGGAISAILLKIPGAPANIATVMDGYPMAKNGRSKEALHYCFISSFIGGVIGIFVLIFFTPVLANFALKFGPSHMFWIAIFGVTVIATLDSNSILKGLFSGAMGLWLATIGYDSVLGVERFVFNPIFSGGINIIAALVGLFAIPQVLSMLEDKQNKPSDQFEMEKRSLYQSFIYNISRVKALIVGSVSGTIIGLIPGAGGQIAGLVSYDQIKKISSNRENFGKGEPDGIIAAESANNAMVGPSLVPLLTLGVPGSPTAAVLLGGLLIHGMFPGANLFTVYAETTWTFINSLLVAQFMMLIFGLYISGLAKYVIKTPANYMAAAITILAIFGTYSVQHNFADVIVMLFLGVSMFFLSKFGFTAAPIVLGLILGPIAEINFSQAKIIADTQEGIFNYLTSGALNLTIISLCLISILYGVFIEIKKKNND